MSVKLCDNFVKYIIYLLLSRSRIIGQTTYPQRFGKIRNLPSFIFRVGGGGGVDRNDVNVGGNDDGGDVCNGNEACGGGNDDGGDDCNGNEACGGGNDDGADVSFCNFIFRIILFL